MRTKTNKEIIVWRWEDAPAKYRNLSKHGGDEDWVAFVPAPLQGDYIRWLEESCFDNVVSEHVVSGGCVYIGAHA